MKRSNYMGIDKTRRRKEGTLLIGVMLFVAVTLSGVVMIYNAMIVEHRTSGSLDAVRNAIVLIETTNICVRQYLQEAGKYVYDYEQSSPDTRPSSASLKSHYKWDFDSEVVDMDMADYYNFLQSKNGYKATTPDFPPLTQGKFKSNVKINAKVASYIALPESLAAAKLPYLFYIEFEFTPVSDTFNVSELQRGMARLADRISDSGGLNGMTLNILDCSKRKMVFRLTYMIKSQYNNEF